MKKERQLFDVLGVNRYIAGVNVLVCNYEIMGPFSIGLLRS